MNRALIAVALFFVVACGTENGPTAPTVEYKEYYNPDAVPATTPATVPVSTPDCTGDDCRSPLNAGKLGDGRFDYTNSSSTTKQAFVKYTKPGVVDPLFAREIIDVAPGSNPTSTLPSLYQPLVDYLRPATETCEPVTVTELFQIDTGTWVHGIESVHLTAYRVFEVSVTYQPNPEKCDNECTDQEPRTWTVVGEWSEWEDVVETFTVEVCTEEVLQTRQRTIEYWSQICDQEPVLIDTKTEREKRSVEREVPCPEKCVLPEEGTTLSWNGEGNPEAECDAFETFTGEDYIVGTPPPGFYICKAGEDREVMYSYPQGETCSNGKDISHVTSCVCAE